MWILRISLIDNKGVFSWRNKKFRVRSYAYRSGYQIKGKKAYLNAVILLDGNERNKKLFINSLKEDGFVKKIEINKDLINCLVVKPINVSSLRQEKLFYSLDLIYTKPVFIDERGKEFWEIGSWEKEKLNKIIKIAERLYEGKLLSFRQIKLSESDFLFFSLYPRLTNKQKQAFMLALRKGYYEFPRKIKLRELAKLMEISYTSYQFHLRKAERKIMNSVGLKI